MTLSIASWSLEELRVLVQDGGEPMSYTFVDLSCSKLELDFSCRTLQDDEAAQAIVTTYLIISVFSLVHCSEGRCIGQYNVSAFPQQAANSSLS